jgi:2-hydroxy-3-keto-5-methylthiopentenyl-1-phosphate phosphatase
MAAPGSKRTLVLSDFDGTICSVDMGHELLMHFTAQGWKDVDDAYCRGEIGSRDAYSRLSSLFRGEKEETLAYILARERLDPGFIGFYAFCRHHGIDLVIASDGLDVYIEAILRKHGLAGIPFFANAAVFHKDKSLDIEFPREERCCPKCGTCKRMLLRERRAAYRRIVYIGDGHSDVCPAREADLVFAKGILAARCAENGTPSIPYQDFGDIENGLRSLL